MKNVVNKSIVIKEFRELDEGFLWVHDSLSVHALNESYGKKYNHYFLNPSTFETFGSYGVFPDSVCFMVGE